MDPRDPILQAIEADGQEAMSDPMRARVLMKMLPRILGGEQRPVQSYSGLPASGGDVLADVNALAGQAPSGIGQDVRMGTNLGDVYAKRAERMQNSDVANATNESNRAGRAMQVMQQLAQIKPTEQWEPIFGPDGKTVIGQKNLRTGETKGAGLQEEEFGDPKVVIDKQGQPKVVRIGKRGTIQPIDDFTMPAETEQVRLGDKVLLVDKNTKRTVLEFPMGMNPDALAQLEVTIRGQNLVNSRASEANSIAQGKRADEATKDLREEFNKLPEVKNYRTVIPIINSAQKAPDTIAGDIALAYAVGKVLDPDSVVREGELKLVGNAASLLERYKGELRALTQGKGRLTPQTRAELTKMLQGRVVELKSSHDAARTAYEGVADQRGLNKSQIFIESPSTANPRTVKRTGTAPDGRKVVEYTDGTVEYAQ